MRIYNIVPMILAILTFTSCEEEKLDTYSGKEQVYFNFANEPYTPFSDDSIFVSFAFDEISKTDSIITIPMKVMGFAKDFPRPVNFVLVDSLSDAIIGEDIEYIYDESYIYPNGIQGQIKVRLKNTEKLKNRTLVAILRAMPNEHFSADYAGIVDKKLGEKARGNIYRIFFDAKKGKPSLWAAFEPQFNFFFKAYSNVKLKFICETLGMNEQYFNHNPLIETASEAYDARINPFAMTWMRQMRLALAEYEAAKGPMYDENGERVSF